MSSHKLIPANCTHSKGYSLTDNRCVDCNVEAAPSLQIEQLHQQLLKMWVREQIQPADGSGVAIPFQIMIMMRMQAVEMFLNRQHERGAATAPRIALS